MMIDRLVRQFKQGNDDAIGSIIGVEMVIEGDISFKGKMKVDGKVCGNVKGEYLILTDSGNINGNVSVNTFVCQGQVDGNVKAAKMNVKKEGVINGKLEAHELSVEFGASLDGEIKARTQDLRLIQGSSHIQDQEGSANASSG